MNQFDALCLLLECQSLEATGQESSNSPYAALGAWLLDLCKALISPSDAPSVDSDDQEPTVCRFRMEERFPFLMRVLQARIWNDSSSGLFSQLQLIAREFIEAMAQECDDRFEQLRKTDEQGIGLLAMPSLLELPASCKPPPFRHMRSGC